MIRGLSGLSQFSGIIDNNKCIKTVSLFFSQFYSQIMTEYIGYLTAIR